MSGFAAHAALPEPVREGLARLRMDELYFVPVRHHSPACALALQAMLRELRPSAILIEGPDSFDALLPLLQDARTRPPVAILSQAQATPRDAEAGEDGGELPPAHSAFFPFCDYSPEWIALRLAPELGAATAFIDLPWDAPGRRHGAEDGAQDGAASLMAERYLAHSAYLKALAAASGCRDQDELWDHLFELRPAAGLRDWRGLFADVFAYCAMARADYEPEVLEAEGSLPRERHMAARIREHRARRHALPDSAAAGPIVVVSGGFHTIALQQMLAEADPASTPAKAARAKKAAVPPARDWLIRYSFDRLDALNGYAAGMPSPAWHQWVWDSARSAGGAPDLHAVAAEALTRLARRTREQGLAEQLSTADAQAALLQATRLAALRGHAGPGREDVLDAVRSCFVKGAADEGTAGFAADLRRFFGGSALGDIPPSSGSPPLLEDARRQAGLHGLRLDDSSPRTVRLDLYRKARHRQRSRFLHLMDYLGCAPGRWRSGPDFAAGSGLELLIEEWEVAWTPLVEARLIELAALGPTLAAAALARLRREQAALADQGQARSASAAVRLLTRACVIGLHQQVPALLSLLATHLDEDPDPASVIECAHQLLSLRRARAPLGMQDSPELGALLLRAWTAALYLLPRLAEAGEGQDLDAVRSLVSLRAFVRALPELLAPEPWIAALERLAQVDGAPAVASAAGALLFLDGAWDEEALGAALLPHFGPGASAGQAVRALSGMMAAAPELLLTLSRLRQEFDRILDAWDEQTFIAHLPDLRLAFAQLKPQETARLAGVLAQAHAGLDAALAEAHYAISEADLAAGSALQLALAECLARDGLTDWATGGAP